MILMNQSELLLGEVVGSFQSPSTAMAFLRAQPLCLHIYKCIAGLPPGFCSGFYSLNLHLHSSSKVLDTLTSINSQDRGDQLCLVLMDSIEFLLRELVTVIVMSRTAYVQECCG